MPTAATAQTPSPAAPLDAVAFMAGTWCSAPGSSGTHIEEHYTTPSRNLVLGLSRYLRDGRSVGYEFSRIELSDANIPVLIPMPSGKESVPFTLTRSAPGEAVFENLDHDFPVRVLYHRDADTLLARIEGADGNGQQWRMTPCRIP